MINKRDIVISIILSFLTCGIYGIIWFIEITDDIETVSEDSTCSGALALLLVIVTCGIYRYIWAYKMGKLINQAKEERGMTCSDNSVLYIILELVGLGIVNYCLMQNELNEISNY